MVTLSGNDTSVMREGKGGRSCAVAAKPVWGEYVEKRMETSTASLSYSLSSLDAEQFHEIAESWADSRNRMSLAREVGAEA